jgi:F0F1-type ATP synthase membrane subunit b/b'
MDFEHLKNSSEEALRNAQEQGADVIDSITQDAEQGLDNLKERADEVRDGIEEKMTDVRR